MIEDFEEIKNRIMKELDYYKNENRRLLDELKLIKKDKENIDDNICYIKKELYGKNEDNKNLLNKYDNLKKEFNQLKYELDHTNKIYNNLDNI